MIEVAGMSLGMVWAEIAVAALRRDGILRYRARRARNDPNGTRSARFGSAARPFISQKATVMKSNPCLVAIVGLSLATAAQAAEKVTLQLKWVAQAQFAGYYVAKDKGYYKDAGLDVTINAGGPDVAPPQVIAGGGADVVIDWMPSALASRERGVPLVNIAQPFKRSGLELTCRAETGIKRPAGLKDKTLGVWFSGNEYPFLAWMAKLGYKTDGSLGGVTVVKQGFNVDLLLQKRADCISTMTYNEYWQVIDAGYQPSQLVVFKYEDQRVATLEDGLYVIESKLKNPAFVTSMAKFVRASMKGWSYARSNPDDATKVVLANDLTGAQTERRQRRMLDEVVKLLDSGDGKLDPKDYIRTVAILLSGRSDPVITRPPTGASSSAVYDAMN
jgi:NitT/TauT family transport system substrate-binding protein